jgi:hypothetical protein
MAGDMDRVNLNNMLMISQKCFLLSQTFFDPMSPLQSQISKLSMPKLPIVVPVVPTPIHETNAHYAHSLHGW